ncbi:hypothetical protein [Vulcanococcus limneticus]|uniref:hypothetical protein n=1 Tax=Vulcanococcus limneticus TaxID=2170428 RepID=UPI00398BCC82
MRFYAVRTEAIHQTHVALQQLEQSRRGSSSPSRAMRVAQLYGHLQCRAHGNQTVQLGLRDLAAAWHLQPRLLRTDLRDLQALGWLTYSSGPQGTWIRLQNPGGCSGVVANDPGTDPASSPAAKTPERSFAVAVSEAEPSLIDQFAQLYNRQRPSSWPAYSPRGSALSARLRRAIAHAGDAETFWAVLAQSLAGMPEFWRRTYPQGRSGADCAAALFSADRQAAGLGVEFWHVFCWGGARGPVAGGGAADSGQGSAAGPGQSDLERAQRLLYWAGNHWRGTGIEASKLERSEKRRLAELLEAAGVGLAGAAAEQFSRPVQTY